MRRLILSSVILCMHVLSLSTVARAHAGAQPASTQQPLTVFLIPHSHCDAGWIRTFEEYYDTEVSDILDSVVYSLAQSNERKFNWAEICFFERWYEKQNTTVRQQVKTFVSNGQLEFIGGGWVQADEACTTLKARIEQLTLGHQYIVQNFGEQARPKIAWQIDPFGESSLSPTLFSMAGFQALVGNRIPNTLMDEWQAAQNLEFYWQGSKDSLPQHTLFTHIFDSYFCLTNFSFDWGWENQTDPAINASNIVERATNLVIDLKKRATWFRTPNLLVPFGCDFSFQRNSTMFDSMDKVVAFINANSSFNVHMRYATLSEYFDTVLQSDAQFPAFEDDLFPIGGGKYAFWSGFFRSRALLKEKTREVEALIRSAEQLDLFASMQAQSVSYRRRELLDLARRNDALLQHHDAITGTSPPHTNDDWLAKLDTASGACLETIGDAVNQLLLRDSIPIAPISLVGHRSLGRQGHVIHTRVSASLDTRASVAESNTTVLWFANSLGWPVTQQIVHYEVAAGSSDAYRILDGSGRHVPYQAAPSLNDSSKIALFFPVDVPALGINTYFLVHGPVSSAPSASTEGERSRVEHPEEEALVIESEFMSVTFEVSSGRIIKMASKLTNTSEPLEITFVENLLYYIGNQSDAYQFVPDKPPVFVGAPALSVVKGDLMQAITQEYILKTENETFSVIVENRLYKDSKALEQIYRMGPVLKYTDLVMRYDTNLHTDSILYVDNGLEAKAIAFDPKAPNLPAGNYHPLKRGAFLRSTNSDIDAELTLVTSSSTGVASLADGSIEIMLFRRHPDLFPYMNDTDATTFTVFVALGSRGASVQLRRELQTRVDSPLTVIAIDYPAPPTQWLKYYTPSFSPLSGSLPSNVNLLSLASLAYVNIQSDVAEKLWELVTEYRNAMTFPPEPKIQLPVMQTIESFLIKYEDEIYSDCSANGWQPGGEGGYVVELTTALSAIEAFTEEPNVGSEILLNEGITQLHWLLTNRNTSQSYGMNQGDLPAIAIRLQHLYACGEDAALSTTATIDISTLFSSFTVKSAQPAQVTLLSPQTQGVFARNASVVDPISVQLPCLDIYSAVLQL